MICNVQCLPQPGTCKSKLIAAKPSFEVQLRKLICQQLAGITLPDVAAYFHISIPYASDLVWVSTY